MPQTCSGAAVPGCLIRPGRWPVALLVGLALSLGMIIETQAATTWTVCASGCDYTSIKAAIAAPTTLDGDTLAIAAGTYTEAGITVTKSLTLQGADANTTIVQAAEAPNTAPDRVFTIASGVTVTLQELTIRYGKSNPEAGGGGIWNDGTLTLLNSTIRNNRAPVLWNGGGGGIWNTGTLTLIQSTICNNWTEYVGGGISNEGTLTLIQSTICSNATKSGHRGGTAAGGISNLGTATLLNSIIRDNSAATGGGIWNVGSTTLTNSTVRDNFAWFDGGGLYNTWTGTLTLTTSTLSGNTASDGGGGGLYNEGSVTLTHSTLSSNSASYGDGLLNYWGYHGEGTEGIVVLTHSTLSSNSSIASGSGLINFYGQIRLLNSIVATNSSHTACTNMNYSSIISEGYNLDSDGSCQLTAPTDQPGVDPLLGPLQDNGGPTFTHALLPGSPAIDAIPWGTNGCGTTHISDQRWQARPQPAGGACDISAYEVTVAGQALGGWVSGLTPQTVVCQNETTGQVVTLSDPVSPWDCEAAGVGVTAGDRVTMHVRGRVKKGATDVGGAVAGMAPTSGGCTNRTTGQEAPFEALFQGQRGATAASCVAAGLVVQPGDHVQLHVAGAAE